MIADRHLVITTDTTNGLFRSINIDDLERR